MQTLFRPRVWTEEQLLKCFVRDPMDIVEEADGSVSDETIAIRQAVFEKFQKVIRRIASK